MDVSSVTPSPQALKALAHPVRLRMLGLLRLDGPATATTLAGRLGLNTGTTSYHLRQLAEHGFVVDDPERGNGRERWWRARHQLTEVDTASATTPEEHETYDAYLQAVAINYAGNLQASVEQLSLLPAPWREAGTMSDRVFRLTPARASALTDRLLAILDEVEDDDDPDAAPFMINVNTYRHPRSLAP